MKQQNLLEKKNGPIVFPYEWNKQRDTHLKIKNTLKKEEKSKHMTETLDHLTVINWTHIHIKIEVCTIRQSKNSEVKVTSCTN
jgi:hypothetical protein